MKSRTARSGTPKSNSSSASTPSSTDSEVSSLPQSLIASANYAQVHGSFLEHSAPTIRVNSLGAQLDLRNSAGSTWLYSAHDQAQGDGLLSTSLAAVSLAYHESQNGLEKHALGSRVLYGKAMNMLSGRLGTMNRALDDSTLAAAMLLVSFEVCGSYWCSA